MRWRKSPQHCKKLVFWAPNTESRKNTRSCTSVYTPFVFFRDSYYLPQTPTFLQRLRSGLGFVAAYFGYLIQNLGKILGHVLLCTLPSSFSEILNYLPQTPTFLQRLRSGFGFVAAYFGHLIQNIEKILGHVLLCTLPLSFSEILIICRKLQPFYYG